MGIRLLTAFLLVPPLACSCGEDAATSDAAPDLGTGYEYQEDTLARFRLLLEDEGWTLAEPPHNPQGMLEVVHGRTGLAFVLIPPGSFLMGSPEDEEGRWELEGVGCQERMPGRSG